MKLRLITKEEAVKRLKKGKLVFGLSESHYLNDEWVELSVKYTKSGLDVHYRKFGKIVKGT